MCVGAMHACTPAYAHTYIHTYIHIYIYIQTDRQTERQHADIQAAQSPSCLPHTTNDKPKPNTGLILPFVMTTCIPKGREIEHDRPR